MERKCKNCKYYNSKRTWVSAMTGEVSFECHSMGCACCYWEAIPDPNALKLFSRIIAESDGSHRIEYYVIKDGVEKIISD